MKYPKGSKINHTKQISYANRGMSLENDINLSNEYYLLNDIGIIHKKPTPITINRVEYPSRKDAVIKEAHFKIPSTTDYNGIYKGKYIDFEAKETKNDKGFPLINIHEHQLKHLENIVKHGGIGFIIIRFTKYNKTYLIDINPFMEYVNQKKRSSVSLDYIEKNGYIIREKFNPRLDYLSVVDEVYFKGDNV